MVPQAIYNVHFLNECQFSPLYLRVWQCFGTSSNSLGNCQYFVNITLNQAAKVMVFYKKLYVKLKPLFQMVQQNFFWISFAPIKEIFLVASASQSVPEWNICFEICKWCHWLFDWESFGITHLWTGRSPSFLQTFIPRAAITMCYDLMSILKD